MSNTKHTPTPWRESLRADAIVVDRMHEEPQRAETTAHYGGYVVAESLSEADRALVLRAVNSHEQLVAALRGVIAATDAYSTLHAPDEDDVARMVQYAAAFDNARAVLVAVEA